ncbi:CheR family methyltransferase [Spongiibacter marinus]|uniref:CheR family methyltransferase n=1 Tax=Spongiibacter marinus TaxID=354246 RepID=UPI0004293338|nr:protein-glutamate O-methyltransferase CheR [Spongiibacter marinus]
MSAAEDLSDVKFEFQFKDRDFDKLKEIVYARTGITLGEEKRQLVYSRFAKRLRKLNLRNFSEYIEYFEQNEESEVTDFINAITTNFTSFFREPHHFEFLKDFIASRDMASKYCRIWSAGCSSGEEPYSIAMTVLDSIANPDSWDLKILCTDIDTSVLRKAEQGVYDAARVEGIDERLLSRFFMRGKGPRKGFVKVRDDVRTNMVFRQLNFLDEFPFKKGFDLIFFRNVIIYFDKDTQRKIFSKIAKLQKPGDVLIIGHSENLAGVTDKYALIGRTIYQRLDN